MLGERMPVRRRCLNRPYLAQGSRRAGASTLDNPDTSMFRDLWSMGRALNARTARYVLAACAVLSRNGCACAIWLRELRAWLPGRLPTRDGREVARRSTMPFAKI